MPATLVQIDGWDPVAGAAVTLRAASHDDSRLCHLNNQTWWPAIAKLPTLRYDLFDGAFTGQITAPSSSLTLSTEAWPNFARYSLADAAIQLWTGEIGAPFSSYTLRFAGRIGSQPQLADLSAQVDFAVDDRWLDTALLATYAGTTGAEGPAGLKGQPKPLALGAPRYVAGTLIDSVNSVFQVSAYGAVNGFETALEKLARFGAPIADYASYAALVAAAIPAGSWATARAVGMARFGAPPTGQVSFLVQGDRAGPNGWARKPGQIIRRLAQLAGGLDKIDAASLDALDAACPYTLSLYLDQQSTARDLIQKIAASVNAVAFVSWTGKLLVLPVALGTPTTVLAADGSSMPPVKAVKQIDIAAPWKKLGIGAERAWTVHALSDIAFTATLLDRGRYIPAETYREGNIVDLADGSRWLFTGSVAATGVAPDSAGQTQWASLSPPTKAQDIAYDDGQTLEDLKPAEPGSTAGAPAGTLVAGIPAEDISGKLDATQTALAGAEQDISDLFETYGSTESAASSAASAAASANLVANYGGTANLLTNGSAELIQLQPWTKIGTIDITPVQGQFGEGTYFSCAGGSNSAGVTHRQSIALRGGTQLSLQAEMLTAGLNNAYAYVVIRFLNSSGQQIWATELDLPSGNGWTRLKLENFAAPSGAVTAYIEMGLYGSGTWNNTNAGWRRIKLESGPVCTAYTAELNDNALQGAISTEQSVRASAVSTLTTQYNGLSATVGSHTSSIATQSSAIATLNSQAATTEQRLLAGQPNLIPNSTFESGFANWTAATGMVAGVSASWGNVAAISNVTGGAQEILRTAKISIYGGKYYTVAADMALFANTTSAQCYVDIIFLAADGTTVLLDGGQNPMAATQDFSETAAKRLAFSHTDLAPTDAKFARVRFVVIPNGATISSASIRRVKLEQGSVMSAYTAEASAAYQAGVIADNSGKLQSYLKLTTSAGAAAAAVKLVATDANGNTYSGIALEAQEITLSTSDGLVKTVVLKLENGTATFTGKLRAASIETNMLQVNAAVIPAFLSWSTLIDGPGWDGTVGDGGSTVNVPPDKQA